MSRVSELCVCEKERKEKRESVCEREREKESACVRECARVCGFDAC